MKNGHITLDKMRSGWKENETSNHAIWLHGIHLIISSIQMYIIHTSGILVTVRNKWFDHTPLFYINT